ncbi:MAG: sugar ABC transporter permease [Defluviitaleaceae bacterium]|nr:sugar ABC transporter permease [Defluviitaleaceae bacterium]MCL2263298.1 sugar ABC transporter permease [Defluviitaleaceae bacterium]
MKAKAGRKGLTLRNRELVWGLIFISPWLIGVIFFFLFNLIQSVVFSFNNLIIDQVHGGFDLHWVGLRHYHDIFFIDGNFVRELFESVGFMLLNVPLIIFFSLFMAILLNRAFMGRGLVRAIFFLPVIMATSAIEGSLELIMGIVMGGVSSVPDDVMRAQQGFDAQSIAMMLSQFGIPMQVVEYIIEAIAMLHSVIRAGGVQILIFLAALQAIPPSMYEVAQIEGATGYEAFWKITIPMVSPLILTNVIYTIVDTFVQSDVVATARATAFQNVYVLEGVRGFDFGRGSAMAVVSSLLACLVLMVVGWAISKYVFYYN